MAGAFLSAAVAIACSLRSPTVQTRRESTTGSPPVVQVDVPGEWFDRPSEQAGGLGFTVEELRGFGLRVFMISAHEDVPGFETFRFDRYLYVRRAGWPFTALECSAQRDTTDTPTISHSVPVPDWLHQADSPWFFRVPAQIPLKPLPGFALDTVVYGLFFWMLYYASTQARRQFRIARNRCIKCNYSRAGLSAAAACPECGASAPSS